MSATISLPSASAKLESAQGPALTSGAALCAAVTPATPDAVEAAIATTERKAAEEQAKAEAEAKAKAEAGRQGQGRPADGAENLRQDAGQRRHQRCGCAAAQ